MSEEVEEIPPYEDWLVRDLKAELSARKLNNAGAKPELVERLYMDDELGVDDVEEDPEGGHAEVKAEVKPGGRFWVDGDLFYVEFVEDLAGDDFNKLPTTDTHHRLLVESHDSAVRSSGKTVRVGPYGGSLVSKTLDGSMVRYLYSVAVID